MQLENLEKVAKFVEATYETAECTTYSEPYHQRIPKKNSIGVVIDVIEPINFIIIKGINNHIFLFRMIHDCTIIIFQKLHPPPQPQIQIFLLKNILKAFMISVNFTCLA